MYNPVLVPLSAPWRQITSVRKVQQTQLKKEKRENCRKLQCWFLVSNSLSARSFPPARSLSEILIVFDSCFSEGNKHGTGAFWERTETYAEAWTGSDKEQLLWTKDTAQLATVQCRLCSLGMECCRVWNYHKLYSISAVVSSGGALLCNAMSGGVYSLQPTLTQQVRL